MSINLRLVVERRKEQMVHAMVKAGAIPASKAQEFKEMSYSDLEHEYSIFKHNQEKEKWLSRA